VRFVETIFSESFHLIPYLHGLGLGDFLFSCSFQKLGFFFPFHLLGFFFADDLAKGVRFRQFISADGHRDLHYLFLIDNNSVSLLQNSFQFGSFIKDFCLSLLSRNEFINVIHWSGTVKGNQSDHVLNAIRSHPDQYILHPRTFQLEDPIGIAPHEQFVGFPIIERKVIDIHVNVQENQIWSVQLPRSHSLQTALRYPLSGFYTAVFVRPAAGPI